MVTEILKIRLNKGDAAHRKVIAALEALPRDQQGRRIGVTAFFVKSVVAALDNSGVDDVSASNARDKGKTSNKPSSKMERAARSMSF